MKMTLYIDITEMPDDLKIKTNADKDIVMTPDGKSYMPILADVRPSSMIVKYLDPNMP